MARIRTVLARRALLVKIAQVSPYSLSVPGGVQGQVLGLAETLRRQGHDCHVLAPCDGPPPGEFITPLGKSVPTAVNGSVAPIAPDPACAFRTLHALRNERFDVIHLHEPFVPGPTLTALLAANAPIVGTFHSAGSRTAYGYARRAIQRAARRLNVRVAVSSDALRTARRAIDGEFTVLFNGIDVVQYQGAPIGKGEPPMVLFLGRHEPRKGLAVLLEALQHVDVELEAWIAGTGPQTDQLRAEFIQDSRLRWLGRLSESQKIECLRMASVLCAPSIDGESFGLVLLEGMAAKTPVVASDLQGYANVARGGRDALLTPVGDVPALASGLRRVLSEPELAQTLVKSGSERVQDFSMDRLAEEYVKIYSSIV